MNFLPATLFVVAFLGDIHGRWEGFCYLSISHIIPSIRPMPVPLKWYPQQSTPYTPYIVGIYWVYPLLRRFSGGQTARVPSQGYPHFPYDILWEDHQRSIADFPILNLGPEAVFSRHQRRSMGFPKVVNDGCVYHNRYNRIINIQCPIGLKRLVY